jgi:hypothetical protein
MVKSFALLEDELASYANPKTKLSRLVKAASLIQLRRGLYTDNKSEPPCVIAAALYGPSYVSFQYALSLAGLIPERVIAVTSASYNKAKNKVFRTPLGDFYYYCIPKAVYSFGVGLSDVGDESCLIAQPEKALCDLVYRTPSVTSKHAMAALLFEDWRLEESDILNLDRQFITSIAPLYKRKSVAAFAKYINGDAE